jgi:hypothetical protein
MVALLSLCIGGVSAHAQSPAELTAGQWQSDLAYLSNEMKRRHANLFHTISETDFDQHVRELNDRIPQLKPYQITVEFARLFAMIRDSHTSMGTIRQPAAGFHRLPIQLAQYADGLWVVATDSAHRQLAGSKVVRIGTGDVKSLMDSAAQITASDEGNEFQVLRTGPIMIATPEILAAFHFTPDADSVWIVTEDKGKTTRSLLRAIARESYDKMSWVTPQVAPSLRTSRPKVPYWFEYEPAQKMMFVQINQMENDTAEATPDFFQRAVKYADSVGAERFVIDLRNNDGGTSNLVRPILLPLIKSANIDRHGHLFALIGHVSASATTVLLNDLERLTNVVFIGEPTGQAAHFWSDGYLIELPNSHLRGQTAVFHYVPWNSRDKRTFTPPHVAAEMKWEDVRAGRDVGLNEALTYSATAPIPARLLTIAQRLGVDAAGDTLAAVRRQPQMKYRNLSREIIRYAFDVLATNNKRTDARLLLEANMRGIPDDWNTHDALAGLYWDLGMLDEAMAQFTEALRLSPREQSVISAIGRLRAVMPSVVK